MMSEVSGEGRVVSSEYMQWAKTRSQARFNLASSGVANYPLSELPVRLEELELTGQSFYGYPPLQELLAAKAGVPVECVVAATGTSMANHLVLAALVSAGEEVLIEWPAYELLVAAARYVGARVRRFARRAEEQFRLDPAEVRRQLTERTRLVVITNLHNPSSAYAEQEALAEVGAAARAVGAHVLVDEVYLDALFERAPPSAFHLGENFIATGSLTKVYGLSGLRCGWALARAPLARRLWLLNDLFGVIPAHVAERLSCVALANLARVAARAQRLLAENGALLNEFLRTRDDLAAAEHTAGTVAFPRLQGATVEELCRLLARKYETAVVPGRFFEMPEHFRLGIGGETAQVSAGLARLAAALDELREARRA